MNEIAEWVRKSQQGDCQAFAELVGMFQHMAYGYAYALLGDFHLAEDAAQEAFVECFRCLGQLEDPAAFPGWLRRIVQRRCQRLAQRAGPLLPLELAGEPAAGGVGPREAAERHELRESVLAAIRRLGDNERAVTSLFYINGYSQSDIAAFLGVPVSTVKNRLLAARNHLRERMMNMVADELKSHAPDDGFRRRTLEQAFAANDLDAVILAALPPVEELLKVPPERWPIRPKLLYEQLRAKGDYIKVFREEGVTQDDMTALMAWVPRQTELMKMLLELVRKHPRIATTRGFNGNTLLHLLGIPLDREAAALAVEIAKQLLSSGADVNARSVMRGASVPLHMTVLAGNLDAVRLLLDRGADVNARSKDGETPAHFAAAYGSPEMLGTLLDRGADVEARAENGGTLLDYAAGTGRLDNMALLLGRGLPATTRGKFGDTAMHWAIGGKQPQALKLLLERGGEPNQAGRKGKTPLHWVCESGELDMLAMLLDHGADMNQREEKGYTALAAAIWFRQMPVMHVLLKRGADVNAGTNTGTTPMHLAAKLGNLEAMAALLKRGAAVDALEQADYAPLHFACWDGQAEAARWLLKHGAAIDAISKDGMGALSLAQKAHHQDVIALLKSYRS